MVNMHGTQTVGNSDVQPAV